MVIRMKITEDCINHNAMKLIDESNLPWEMCEANDDADHQRLISMGYNSGVLDMAKVMKEVLKQ